MNELSGTVIENDIKKLVAGLVSIASYVYENGNTVFPFLISLASLLYIMQGIYIRKKEMHIIAMKEEELEKNSSR